MNMKFMFTTKSAKPRQTPMVITRPTQMINKLNSIHTIINTPKTSCGSCGRGS